MFNQKKKNLFKTKVSGGNANQFLFGASKQAAVVFSGNNAVKYSTTNSDFVDQFGKVSQYNKPRSFEEISRDCNMLWSQDSLMALKFTLYLRMISRKTDIHLLDISTTECQHGAGLKHEGIMRMLWLSINHSDVFHKNLGLFLSAGSYKDLITMLRYDLVYHGWEGRKLDWDRIGVLIASALINKPTSNLMKKYLPQIRATSKCSTVDAQANTIIAKWICNLLFGSKANNGASYKQYRQLKASGTAHSWQQAISRKRFDLIDFNKIHGRALYLLAKSKFFKTRLRDEYTAWATKSKRIKFTGYVHELLCELDLNRDKVFELTVDKQFEELVAKAKDGDNNTNMIVVRDISGSMCSPATGTKYSSASITKALAIYFSKFLTGVFADHCINFSSTAKLHKWVGSTSVEKWRNDRYTQSASTNFQSVVDLFCSMKAAGVPESDFPGGILCMSDGEFNSTHTGKTNIETMYARFKMAGFSSDFINNFRVVFWNIPNSFYGSRQEIKFETFGDVKNVFYMSGYSASNIKFALNQKNETAVELFEDAMNQELLNLVSM